MKRPRKVIDASSITAHSSSLDKDIETSIERLIDDCEGPIKTLRAYLKLHGFTLHISTDNDGMVTIGGRYAKL